METALTILVALGISALGVALFCMGVWLVKQFHE